MPELKYGSGDDAGSVRMTPAADGSFTATFDRVTKSFPYFVVVGPARSDEFAIEVIRPARVTRIDVRYTYPEGLGLESAGGRGSRRYLRSRGHDGGADGHHRQAGRPRRHHHGRWQHAAARQRCAGADASMPIRADGSYRVALTDVDGLDNPGDTEYFIRMLNDRPPDVRVMRPGGDKQVTPLEEVTIEAQRR